MKHPHYDCIVAWAEGKEIQFRKDNGSMWSSLRGQSSPGFYPHYQYRIKPETKKYRVWETKHGLVYVRTTTNIGYTTDEMLEKKKYFGRWLTDWIEYE